MDRMPEGIPCRPALAASRRGLVGRDATAPAGDRARHVTALDASVLRALPPNAGPGRWPTASVVASHLAIADDSVARAVLVRLRRLGLIEDDGERPQAFARTYAGEVALEWQPCCQDAGVSE